MKRMSWSMGFGLLAVCLAVTGCTNKPAADFSANVTAGTAPLTVHFTDLSAPGKSTITAWHWLFGDGAESTEQTPSHVYAAAGKYSVSLEVTASSENDTESKPNYITVTVPGGGGEGEAEGESEGEGEGGPIPYAQSQAMIDAVTAQVMGEVADTPLADVLGGAEDFLAGHVLVAQAGRAETGAGVWARLKDGSYYLLMVDPKSEIEEGAKSGDTERSATPAFPQQTAALISKSGTGTPALPLVFLNLQSGDPAAAERVQQFKGYASNHGYSNAVAATVSEGSAVYGTIDWFKTLANYGVAYVNSKGMTFSLFKDGKAPWVTAVMTTDPRDLTREYDPSFLVEKVAGRIFDGTVVSWKKGSDGATYPIHTERYFVSSRFFLAHCGAFEQNSLVYLDGGAFRSTDMADVFTGKNAGMFMGWNAMPARDSADTAARYIFSRAFGEQTEDAPVPPNRPSSVDESYMGLQLKNLDTSLSPYDDSLAPLSSPIALEYESGSTYVDVLLRPSIWGDLWMARDWTQLAIPGNFGEKTGTVTVGGKDAAVVEWIPGDAVFVQVGPRDKGDVVVTVDGHESNAVPLCEWTGNITAEGDLEDRGPHVTIKCAARVRSDLHKHHVAAPDQEPFTTPCPSAFEPDCTGTAKFNGTFVINDTMYEWSGEASLDFHVDAAQQCIGSVIFQLADNKATVSLVTGLYEVNLTITDLSTGEVTHTTQICAAAFNVEVPLQQNGSTESFEGVDPVTNLKVTVPSMSPDPPYDPDTIPG